jgi:2-methylisocitrate lyase-like PEP mutase family enzyme
VAPKRCGHVAGKQVIPIAEAVGKYRAALKVRDEMDPNVVLVARCDARGVAGGSIEQVIERCKAYRDAGVDVVFPEGVISREEVEQVSRAVDVPLFYNRTGVSPNMQLSDMRDLRIFLVINANGAHRAGARAMWDYLHAFAREDAALDVRLAEEIKQHPLADFHAFVGFPRIRALEEQFLPADDVARKYEGSLGFRP